jgi:hypothetical protein
MKAPPGFVSESSTCRERKSGAENKRSAKHDFSGREHLPFYF